MGWLKLVGREIVSLAGSFFVQSVRWENEFDLTEVKSCVCNFTFTIGLLLLVGFVIGSTWEWFRFETGGWTEENDTFNAIVIPMNVTLVTRGSNQHAQAVVVADVHPSSVCERTWREEKRRSRLNTRSTDPTNKTTIHSLFRRILNKEHHVEGINRHISFVLWINQSMIERIDEPSLRSLLSLCVCTWISMQENEDEECWADLSRFDSIALPITHSVSARKKWCPSSWCAQVTSPLRHRWSYVTHASTQLTHVFIDARIWARLSDVRTEKIKG